MTSDKRSEQAFSDFLEGKSASASPEVERLAKLTMALGAAPAATPSPAFRARLRSTILAHASASEEDAFAAALEGVLLESPAEVKPLVAVAAALEPARLPLPDVTFRYELRTKLLREAARRRPLGARIAERMATLNGSMQRSFRVLVATGMLSVMLAGSSIAVAMSDDAVAGDALYAVKRWHEVARLLPLSGAAEGRQLMAYADRRVSELHELDRRGVAESAPYLDTLALFNDQTSQGTEIMIGVFRETGVRAVLDEVRAFAQAQAGDLNELIPELPAAVQPAARDSLAHVEDVVVEVDKVLSGCEICPPSPYLDPEAAADATRLDEQGTCACEPQAGGSEGTSGDGQTPSGSDGSGNGGQNGDDEPDDPSRPPTTEDEPTVDMPDEIPDDVEDPAEDLIDGLLDDVEETLPPLPSPLPSEPGDLLP